jgi:predicted nucleic acid-binding Zn ribbon protein
MPLYEYRCPQGCLLELTQPMSVPTPAELFCDEHGTMSPREWTAPVAIIFRGRGFYSTDVKGGQERKRRKNAGDDLLRSHDPTAAAIARSL